MGTYLTHRGQGMGILHRAVFGNRKNHPPKIRGDMRDTPLHLEHLEGRFTPSVATNQVTNLYRFALGRDPEPAAMASLSRSLESGQLSVGRLTDGILHSREHTALFVSSLYSQFLGRSPTSTGLESQVSAIRQGESQTRLESTILGSNEYYVRQGADNTTFVRSLYTGLLGREPDTLGLQVHYAALAHGMSRTDLANSFLVGREYGNLVAGDAYHNLLGRVGNSRELSTWSGIWGRSRDGYTALFVGIAGSSEGGAYLGRGPIRNLPPTVNPGVSMPDSNTGLVTGSINASDPNNDRLTFFAPALTSKGSIKIFPDGHFDYTPSAGARNAAGAVGATSTDKTDAFTVTVTDGYGGSIAVPVMVTISPATNPTGGPLVAFPGAEGFGAQATGGRGGGVIYVTNLNTEGPGSLQWAIDQPGARYILFKVSGVINGQIHLTRGDVTIAGQTSPGGVTVRGFVTDETPFQDQEVRAPSQFSENWILQHIRIRPGTDPYSDDGLRIRYTRDAVVDHVSIGNATDEAIEISFSNNITVQNTLLAETLGDHSQYGGLLMNYSNPANGFKLDNISLHHNVFNRISGRLPEGSRESIAAANSFMNLEMSNNLYWDPRFFVALSPNTGVATDASGNSYPVHWKINAVNNYFRTGESFPYAMFDNQIMDDPQNQLYVSGNQMSLYPTRADYNLFWCCNDYASLTNEDLAAMVAAQRVQKLASRNPFPAISYTSTGQLAQTLLDTAGAWPRDPMDLRLLRNVASNTISTAPINVNPSNDALLTAFAGIPPAAPLDTDNDGMPDTWELSKGLNPGIANTNATNLSSQGYTDLEIYLQELSASRISGWA